MWGIKIAKEKLLKKKVESSNQENKKSMSNTLEKKTIVEKIKDND